MILVKVERLIPLIKAKQLEMLSEGSADNKIIFSLVKLYILPLVPIDWKLIYCK